VFDVAAEAYDRYMGRYSSALAPQFCDFARITAGQRVLDVGCGPGTLTAELVRRVGAASVSAVDPSAPFVSAARERHAGVDVRHGSVEPLPFEDEQFDAALGQLVVHFMGEPRLGILEMKRVTRPGGVVAACVWDHGGGSGPASPFWTAARKLDPSLEGESRLAGSRRGHLAELLGEAGLGDVEQTVLSVGVAYATFEEWWEPFTLGVGPAGSHLARLGPERQARLRDRCRELFPADRLVRARAWAARGIV
jgi:SAM-dependent methyltransferase